jgi:phosphate transport system permease protein
MSAGTSIPSIKTIINNSVLPSGEAYRRKLRIRHVRGTLWKRFYFLANVIALLALIALFLSVIDRAFGLVATEFRVSPESIVQKYGFQIDPEIAAQLQDDDAGPEVDVSSTILLENLTEEQLVTILSGETGGRFRVIIRDNLSAVRDATFVSIPLREAFPGIILPAGKEDVTINDLTREEQGEILINNLDQGRMVDITIEQVLQPRIVSSWSLVESLTNQAAILEEAGRRYPNAEVTFRSWVSLDFITSSISSTPTTAGLRTALFGTLWVVLIAVAVALPVGIAAAIYLEEYATGKNWFERTIQTNIRNLAGVPSIIYGLLGLFVFVRAIGFFTSGEFIGITDSNGRTVISAAFTLALLMLPVIIINAQEAIRAVPPSIREGSYGMGATKWQTIYRQVLPVAFPGILTGMILSMSRAIGETAPLVVVGASTFIGIDPNGPFSKFTVVPIQIYQWTGRPEAEFARLAAAAIIVLLALLITLNATAIILRQYYRRKLQL